MSEPIWVIGAGGHARVVIDTLQTLEGIKIAGILDDAFPNVSPVLGVPVLGPATPESVIRLGVRRAFLAIGSNPVRAEIAVRLGASVSWATLVNSRAILARDVKVGQGTIIMAGAIVHTGSVIGMHSIINTASTVDHDCRLGDYVHLAPGVHLAGGVQIDEGAFLGIGSCVIPGRTIGAWATIGAGGIAVSDIPPGVVAKGLPARWEVVDSKPST